MWKNLHAENQGFIIPEHFLSAKRYCAAFKHNMMTVQAGLGERQKNSQVGNSTVRQIQSRWITQTAKGRYHKMKILYHPNPIQAQTSWLCPVGTFTDYSTNFLNYWYRCCHFPSFIKLSPVTYFCKSTYTCSNLEDIESCQEKSLVSFNSARLSIILKSCVLILHRIEGDFTSGM